MQLGELYSKRLETSKAVKSFQDALKEARAMCHTRVLLVLVLISFGEALKKAGKLQEALRCFQEAKETMNEIHGPVHADRLTAKILYSLGTIYDDLGDLAKALESYENALNMYSVIYGENNVNETFAIVSLKTACVAQRVGNFIQAKKCFTEGVNIFRKSPITKNTCYCVVSSLFRLSSICEVLGERDEALKHLEEAREVAKVVDFNHVMVLDVLYKLSNKYNNEMRSFEQFMVCFQEFNEMAQNVIVDDSMPPYLIEMIELLK